jgi:xanthine dehydrogenase YagS FAD-binding subunit
MLPFAFERAENLAQAKRLGVGTSQGQSTAAVQFLAGGTTLIDLMKLEVLRPQKVVDIGPLHAAYAKIELTERGLELGAFAKMSQVADHSGVNALYPVIAQSLQLAASAQLRNMATVGGNVLQKTRCPYYRDPSWQACNKRSPGSGCAALTAVNRNHAMLGVDETCIAQYPGDFAIALVALDAQVHLSAPQGERSIPFAELHRPVDGKPHIETNLRDGEIITAFSVPGSVVSRRSLYLKIRDRASYEFAIAAAAVALHLEGDTVRDVRIGLGGLAYRPWRAHEAEHILTGKPLTEANAAEAAKAALASARTHGDNDYKPELARQTIVRALLEAKNMTPSSGEPG